MRKKLLLFLLNLTLLTVGLGYLWFWKLQELYPHLLAPAAMPFFQWVGVKKWLLSRVIDHFTNVVPYFALVLAMPKVFRDWKRLIAALLGGLVVLALFHILLSWAVFYFSEMYHFSRAYFRWTFTIFLINDALPLVLWLMFYPQLLRDIIRTVKNRNDPGVRLGDKA